MDIVIADDSIPFDGTTPLNQPLDGAAKAVCGLAAALARRGQRVTVANGTPAPVDHAGVAWRPLGATSGACDLLIAVRRPALLDLVPGAVRRLLWLAGPAHYLAEPAHAEALDRHSASKLVVHGETHRGTWQGDPDRLVVVAPGVALCYREAGPMTPFHPPRAVVTTHPRNDLDWLIALWTRAIRPRVADAELLVYSAALASAAAGGDVANELRPVLGAVLEAADAGVRAVRPLADPDMAEAYRTARVHLYPGHANEVYAATLAESQATGLPAVGRKLGAVPERVRDARTGYLVPDDEAFANCAVLLLNDDSVFSVRSRDCRSLQRGRDWDAVAAEFEALAA